MSYQSYVPTMFLRGQRSTTGGISRVRPTINTRDNYTSRDPEKWTKEDVADYVDRHSDDFASKNRMLAIIRDKSLTGLYFVQIDHEGLRKERYEVYISAHQL
ncbi:hypothetical protein EVJ58_g10313 [Rhodofomes roseus]|uniref:Uncharacterized protein n=1 Tax=Rhodofomes roseus TaxID=34475 RepID=A0A4Y9XP56_9APHY|nr:hypothetical protein EVJ58_g10313 [Rhodofomes roseus]